MYYISEVGGWGDGVSQMLTFTDMGGGGVKIKLHADMKVWEWR